MTNAMINSPLTELYEPVRGPLDAVLASVRAELEPLLAQAGYPEYLAVASEGKLLRPALCLLSAQAVSLPMSVAIPLATVCELSHIATLIHDDVVDDAQQRRDAPTLNARLGTGMAVLLGDRVLSRCLNILSKYNDPEALEIYSVALSETVEGETLQTLAAQGQIPATESAYIEWITKKTAALFGFSLELPAEVSGARLEVVAMLGEFGRNFGIAFQLMDDLLDAAAAPELLGKPTRTDIRGGKLTLPYWRLLTCSDNGFRGFVEQLGEGRPLTTGQIEALDHAMSQRREQVVSECVETIRDYSSRAAAALTSEYGSHINQASGQTLSRFSRYFTETIRHAEL